MTSRQASTARKGTTTRRAPAVPFVGRQEELDTLRRSTREVPSLVIVEGRAGMGKSRLLQEFCSGDDVPRVLVGRCHQLLDPFPLGPLIEATRALGEGLARHGLSPAAGALRALMPELAKDLPPLPNDVGDPAALRHLQFRGFRELLYIACPAVLVVEDLHWVDRQTAEFLGYLLDEMPSGLSLVVTYRSDEVSSSVRALLARVRANLAVARIELSPWGRLEVTAMIAGMVGEQRVSDEFIEHLRRRSAGIPSAVEELLKLLICRDNVAEENGHWWRRTIEALAVPAGVRDPVLERARSVDLQARRMIEASAVLALPSSLDTLMSVADLDDFVVTDACQQALESGLLVDRGGSFEPMHDLARQAIYDDLSTRRRRALHARAVVALRAVRTPPLGQIAHHLREAGQLGEWWNAACRAAEHAWAAGDFEQTVDLLLPLVRLGKRHPEMSQVLVRLLRAAIYSTRAIEVADLVSGCSIDEFVRKPEAQTEVRAWVAMLLSNLGREPQRIRGDAALVVDVDTAPLDLRINCLAITCQLWDGRTSRDGLVEHVTRAEAALRTWDGTEDDDFCAAKLACLRLAAGEPEWRESAPPRFLSDIPSRRRDGMATYHLADAAIAAGHHDLGRGLIDRILQADGMAMPRAVATVVGSLRYELCFWTGEWDGLDSALDQHLTQDVAGVVSHDIERAVLSGLRLAREGPTKRVVGRLEAALDHAAAMGWLSDLARIAGVWGRIRSVDHSIEVPPGLEVVVRAADRGMVLPSMYRCLAPVAVALLRAGRPFDAERLAEQLRSTAPRLDAPLAVAALAQVDGHFAAASGEWELATERFEAAAAAFGDAAMSYDAARAHEEAAVAASHQGVGVDDHLGRALQTYQRLNARWDLDRASALARRHGASVPARHRNGPIGYGNQLSPREREVAVLAAQGYTDAEIAEQLVVSVHTVIRHMMSVRRKLGLRSRRELRGAVVVSASG